ncbi:MAG: PEP-CTERM sorting domain-containing protein [Nitrospirota bacterium]|nr:PEP-CTERM sorting domain-containing protein [Nitrospirota bacterium]
MATDLVSATQSRIQFGLFTAPAGDARFGTITYQVTSTIGPITDFHLVTPPAVPGPPGTGQAFQDAGYVIFSSIGGVGSTFLEEVLSFPGADHALFPAPTFPSGLATLGVENSIQIFGGDILGPGQNPFLTLPHFDNVYTVTVVPEPSTWLLLTSGLIALMMPSRFIRLLRAAAH